MTRRAAHFLLVPELAGSPPNDAIVRTLQELGFEVDLFAPGDFGDAPHGAGVRCLPVEYGKRWLARHAAHPRWRDYSLFSGTSENPLAVVGALSLLHRRPSFALVDEIRSGSYYGNAPESWKKACRWAMRRAGFSIVNDEARVALLREYAGLAHDAKVLVYPGAFCDPPPAAEREALRTRWRARPDALVVGISGLFGIASGAEWLFDSLQRTPWLHAVMQPVGMDPFARLLLRHLACGDRLFVEENRLGWREAWSVAAAFDVGLAIYANPGPQFQHMGISSNRLCMLLCMGVPVIASRQPSFEFLERYDCGVMVGSQQEFDAALAHVRANLPRMRENALRCAREYIRASERRQQLRSAIAELVS